MKVLSSLIAITLAILTVAGCHSTYVVGRNPDLPDAGGSAGKAAGTAGKSGAGGGGLGGGPVVAGSGGAMGTAGAAGSGNAPSGAAGTTGAGGATGSAGSGAFTNPPALDGQPAPESAGTMPLLHLSALELKNTLADLLGASPAAIDNALAGFPSDDVSPTTGYLAPVAYSPAQTDALLAAAELLATPPPSGSLSTACTAPAAGTDATACATTFIGSFGPRAFRRPLSAAESDALLGVFTTAVGLGFDFQGSISEVIVAMLQSPNFLYHWEVGDAAPARVGTLIPLTPYQVASRLSYLLWQTMPDSELMIVASGGQLSTPEQILLQANRMLGDPRAEAGFANFQRQWLHLTGVESLQEDQTLYPTFTPTEAQAFGTEADRFVSSVLLPAGDGTLKTLLTAPYTYQDDPDAAAIYGGPNVASPGSQLPLNPAERAGILTQAAFLAMNAQPLHTDPLARGFAVWQQFLCGGGLSSSGHVPFTLPDSVDLSAPRRDQYAQIYAQQASPAACTACHNSFDPLGFAFESYDMVGAYRTADNGHPIDASGVTITPAGTSLTFKNAVDLVDALAANDEVKWCVTRQWFRFVLGRVESPADLGSMELAYKAGAAVPGFSIRQMLASLVQTQAFRYRAPSPGEL